MQKKLIRGSQGIYRIMDLAQIDEDQGVWTSTEKGHNNKQECFLTLSINSNIKLFREGCLTKILAIVQSKIHT